MWRLDLWIRSANLVQDILNILLETILDVIFENRGVFYRLQNIIHIGCYIAVPVQIPGKLYARHDWDSIDVPEFIVSRFR